jgi:hypothetical protein
MDIKKELIEINLDKSATNKFIQEIEAQQYELSKKSHILKSIALGNEIEDLIKTDLFIGHGVYFLEAYWDKPIVEGDIKLCFCILDSEQKRMSVVDRYAVLVPPFYALEKITHKFNPIKPEFVNQLGLELHSNCTILAIKPGIKEKLLNLLLSTELTAVLDYNKMHISMPTNADHIVMKIKM